MSSELISATLQQTLQQSADTQSVKSQQGGKQRSFEDVLQNGGKQQVETTNEVKTQGIAPVNGGDTMQTSGTSGAKIEQMRVELMNRINDLGAVKAPNGKGDLQPELFYAKNRMSLLKDAMSGMNQNSGKGVELMGRFSQLENESKAIEGIMKSNKDLSPGELLGLQARLYQVSQHIEVMSKVVDQMTGGIKTILNTNV
ncbi:MAG: hypothetical protein H7Z37_11520 [Pyrinomonadaceae bacterium]|nr:hypothetical protein [Pyrinomonadaceae bacterium]